MLAIRCGAAFVAWHGRSVLSAASCASAVNPRAKDMPPRKRAYVVPEENRKLTARSHIDGGARIGNCPRCDEPVIDVLCDGITSRLSRFSVPLGHAEVLAQYGRIVWNVWLGLSRLYCAAWFPDEGRPDKGKLYSQHFCQVRR